MGVCQSKQVRDQIVISQKINRDLNKERKDEAGNQKLLLLGAGECGKSTILKQMQILHKNGFTPEEVEDKKSVIYSNVVMSMGAMLRAMETMEIPLTDNDKEPHVRLILKVTESEADYFGSINDELYTALKLLWSDSGVQMSFARRNEYQLTDSVKYFLDDIDRIAGVNFTPNEQDILMSRVATTGVVEVVFTIKGCIFRVFDVGGQRSERRKWIHLFDDVNAIIFISAISEYNQVLKEDMKTNRMRESMELFRSICNSRWFIKASMILFLNKTDLFKEKLQNVAMNSYFTDYRGLNEYAQCIAFLKEKFEMLNETATKRIYIHETCATDTRQVQQVIDSVVDMVIAKNLKGTGME